MSTEPDEPMRAVDRPHPSLTRREQWTAVAMTVGLMVGSGVIAELLGMTGGDGVGAMVGTGFVFGGLLSLAALVVYVDRAISHRCSRCAAPFDRGASECHQCGYDLDAQPRYRCPEGHDTYLDPGLCDCGRRLQPVERPRGVHGQVVATIALGAGILVFLVVVWMVLALVG